MKTFFKTVLMIIVIILTTWTANADDALYVDDWLYGVTYVDDWLYGVTRVEDKRVDMYPLGCITYLGNNNVNNDNINKKNGLYYNRWFDAEKKAWVAHTTFFFANIYFRVIKDEKTVYEKDWRGVWEWRTVYIYDTISLADPRIENLEFTLKWRSYAIQINNPRTIDVRAKWVEADIINAWCDTVINDVEKLPESGAVANRKFAEDVVGDYIVKGEPEPSTQWSMHTVPVQISTDYTKNKVLCISLGGGDAGGYIDKSYVPIKLKVKFTFNPNKTDNNAKPEAITETHANTVTDNAYYDFTGRKIAYPQSGHTYIHNGKLIRFKKEE